MKKINKICVLLLALCMALVFGKSNVAYAAEYTYTVTFYSGGQGTFSDISAFQIPEGAKLSIQGDKVVVSNVKHGSVVGCSAQAAVSLKEDSKYYVKGIRLSGRDNNKVGYSAFSVVEDQDYVVAYGIKGQQTSYTVNYVDGEGTKLAESRTYYGNVGDEPVIAYLYIEGFVPTTYNLSRPLVSDPADNMFNFIYEESTSRAGQDNDNQDDPNSPDHPDDPNHPDNPDDGNNNGGNDGNSGNDNGGNDGNGGNDNGGNAGENGNGGNAGGNDGNAGNGENDGNGDISEGKNNPVVVPDDGDNSTEAPTNNIDDQEVPQGDGGNGKKNTDDSIPVWKVIVETGLIIPIAVGLISVIVFLIILVNVVKKSKKVSNSADTSENTEK